MGDSATSTLVTQAIAILAVITFLCIMLKILVQLASALRRFVAEKLRTKKRKVEKPDPWAVSRIADMVKKRCIG